MLKLTPNVRALVLRKASLIIIPSGTGNPLATAVANITGGKLPQALKEASAWVEQALKTLRASPDFAKTFPPGQDTDEHLATAIMKQVAEKKRGTRA